MLAVVSQFCMVYSYFSLTQNLHDYKVTQHIKVTPFTVAVFKKICVQSMLNFVSSYKATPNFSGNEIRKK